MKLSRYWENQGKTLSDRRSDGRTFERSNSTAGCAECCNGDRCDDMSHYDRQSCPFCLGTGEPAKEGGVMLERAEELKQRVRETPLNDRLDDARRRIGKMCSEGRPPRMTIPVQYDDDDFYISTTLADAQATIADLQGQIAVERANKESAVACVDRDVKKISALQQRVARLEAERDIESRVGRRLR